ncbi:hypothetical protein NA56DRAFT_696878 [Hyaloscypha hepaticicola]|uniref:Uncharacterized protein n=1 Tax=Hyaloscypha hepaticicola TaxID=2082293 RepID=A0A2J6QNL6_9HELO|nr:hypothetical protein NA56DRAFT_696878 [Hyaloscypha hepaticicola]
MASDTPPSFRWQSPRQLFKFVLASYAARFNHSRLARNEQNPWHRKDKSMIPLNPAQAESIFLPIGVFQLDKIPPEVRLKIYREYFIELSKDPLLYREVLESYYGNYNFRLWNHNELKFHKNVSMNLVRSMRHLTLEYADHKDSSPAGSQHIREHIFATSVDHTENLPNFDQFIKKVWYEPVNAKIHQAMNLKTLTVSVRINDGQASLSGILDLVDLVFLYFPALEKFTVYNLYTFLARFRTFGLGPNFLEALEKELITKKNVT